MRRAKRNHFERPVASAGQCRAGSGEIGRTQLMEFISLEHHFGNWCFGSDPSAVPEFDTTRSRARRANRLEIVGGGAGKKALNNRNATASESAQVVAQ